MQLRFDAVSEPSVAGAKWKHLFDAYWPGYKTWFLSQNTALTPDLITSQEALKKYMPKMWPTYVHLCEITNADVDIARFLTGFQPPAYISACAQVVINTDEIQLVRNYDYAAELLEGTLLLSKWNDLKVMGTSDCLIGLVDGINDSGLCVSLTFGGRKEVGYGFGIPFILRYVLEFCTTTKEAVKVLKSIPSHMSYNVTVVDKTGETKTVMLAPDKETKVSNIPFATNHQGTVDWPENAVFNQTVKRYNFIKNYLKSKDVKAEELAKAFLHPPLYNTKFREGFGTLYTAVYHPEKLRMQLLWPNVKMVQSFDNFVEEQVTIYYEQSSVQTSPAISAPAQKATADGAYNWQDAVVDSLVKSMAGKESKAKQKELREKLMPNGIIAWEEIANFWNEPTSY
jgi:predicted choloylglycine hydrolase